MSRVVTPRNCDTSVKKAIQQLAKQLAVGAEPSFSSLTLTGLTASSIVGANASKLLESVTIGTGLDYSRPTLSLSHLGIESLTDPGGDRIFFWDDSESTSAWLSVGNSLAITATVLDTIQDIRTNASPVFAGATIDNIVFGGVFDAPKEPTGFVDRTATLSWVDGTQTLTITGSHDIYINGVKSTKSTDSIQIADTTGLHWIYYDASGTLTENTVFPGWYLPLMATVYWNTAGGGGSYNKGLAGEERHNIVMDWHTHEYLHNTVGSRFESGLAGTFDDTTITIETGEWHDEDIEHEPAQQTACNVLYKNGSADWEWDAGASVYYKLNGSALRYNNGNALADCTSNRYMAMWIFATNDISVPIVALMGQRQDTKIKDARVNNTYESLELGTLPFQEMKLLYRVILRSTGSPPSYIETLDLRSVSNLPAGTYVATAHNTLTGLDVDDHFIYPLLIGRTGGQELFGSDTTAEDLTLTDNSVDNNSITITQAISAYAHSGLTSGNPHVVTPTELSLVIGTDVQAFDAKLSSLVALTYVSPSFVKMTGANTFVIRTIGETADDLEATINHDLLANGGAHDYSYISGNDGATGITAAELEELSDGSETTLHSHAGGDGSWIGLTDTDPANYVGEAGNAVVVNAGEDGLEFGAAPGGGAGAFTSQCSVYLSGSQTLTTGNFAKVAFDSEDYDNDGEFDTTNNKFVVGSTGYYTIHYKATVLLVTDTKNLRCILYKNKGGGSEELLMDCLTYMPITGSAVVTSSEDVYLETNDELELWAVQNTGNNKDLQGGSLQRTTMSIHRFA